MTKSTGVPAATLARPVCPVPVSVRWPTAANSPESRSQAGEAMAVPKRKKSRSTTRHRRAQWKTTPTQLVEIRVEGKVLRVPRNLVKAYHSGLIDVED